MLIIYLQVLILPDPHDTQVILCGTAASVRVAAEGLWHRDNNGCPPPPRRTSTERLAKSGSVPNISVCAALLSFPGTLEVALKKAKGGDYQWCLSFTISLRCIHMDSDPPICVPWPEQASHMYKFCPSLLPSFRYLSLAEGKNGGYGMAMRAAVQITFSLTF